MNFKIFSLKYIDLRWSYNFACTIHFCPFSNINTFNIQSEPSNYCKNVSYPSALSNWSKLLPKKCQAKKRRDTILWWGRWNKCTVSIICSTGTTRLMTLKEKNWSFKINANFYPQCKWDIIFLALKNSFTNRTCRLKIHLPKVIF